MSLLIEISKGAKKNLIIILIYYILLIFFLMSFSVSEGHASAKGFLGQIFCPFNKITSLPCPFCGITRSVIFASRLDLVKSVEYHPMGLFVFLFLILAPGILIANQNRRYSRMINNPDLRNIIIMLFLASWCIKLLQMLD